MPQIAKTPDISIDQIDRILIGLNPLLSGSVFLTGWFDDEGRCENPESQSPP